MPVAPLLASPASEQSEAVPVVSHDMPKFGGLGDLPSVRHASPPASGDNTTEEEHASDEDEDDSEDDNPITSTPMLQQQPTVNQQVRELMVSHYRLSTTVCAACKAVHQRTQFHDAI